MFLIKCSFSYLLYSYSFQSERETGDRNYAIGYYLKEKKVCVFIFVSDSLFFFLLVKKKT